MAGESHFASSYFLAFSNVCGRVFFNAFGRDDSKRDAERD